jgi:hypothetical protein
MKNFSLKRSVAGLEDAIIVISGPALAISGIIAGVDLVTGGHLLTNLPGLTLAWAITLLLTLDFQVLALGVRGMRVYQSDKAGWRKAVEVLLIVSIAAGISLVSIQMQSIIARVNAEGISLDLAAAQLGVNMIALTWERSTLVLVLIFLSGWLREADHGISTRSAATRSAQGSPVQVTLQSAPQALLEAPKAPDNLHSIYQGRFESKEPAIRAALAAMPEASPEQIAQAAQCSPRTAARWMDKIRNEAS